LAARRRAQRPLPSSRYGSGCRKRPSSRRKTDERAWKRTGRRFPRPSRSAPIRPIRSGRRWTRSISRRRPGCAKAPASEDSGQTSCPIRTRRSGHGRSAASAVEASRAMRFINLTVTLIDDRNLLYKEEPEPGGGNTREVEVQTELDPLRLMTIQRLDYWINQAVLLQQEEFTRLRKQPKLRCGLDDLRTLGLHLFHLLFDNARIRGYFLDQYLRVTKARQTDPDLRLRLHLVFEKPTEKLAALPWEFLMVAPDSDPEHGVFMAGERTELLLTRRIKVPDFVQTLGRQAKLVILLAVCQPNLIDGMKMGAIDAKEVDEIKSALNGLAEAAHWITVEPLIDPTYAELDAAIQKHKPTILHYVGHGRAGDISLRRAEDDDNYETDGPEKQ